MSSTTIRYSGVPENSHSSHSHDSRDRGFEAPRTWRSDRNTRYTGRHRRDERPAVPPQQFESCPDRGPFRFDRLREDAWDRFLLKSEELAVANRANLAALQRERGWQIAQWVRIFRWLTAVIRSLATAQPHHYHRPGPATAKASRHLRRQPNQARSVVSPDRHTYLADRSARFARALRGAQRARAEAAEQHPSTTPPATAATSPGTPPGVSHPATASAATRPSLAAVAAEAHWRRRPVQQRQRTTPGAPTGTPLARQRTPQVAPTGTPWAGGAAWA